MKKRWISWWIVNVFWLVIFGVGSAIIWIREVDGAGVSQTPELKLIAFAVLLIACIIPFVFQTIWAIVNFVVKR